MAKLLIALQSYKQMSGCRASATLSKLGHFSHLQGLKSTYSESPRPEGLPEASPQHRFCSFGRDDPLIRSLKNIEYI